MLQATWGFDFVVFLSTVCYHLPMDIQSSHQDDILFEDSVYTLKFFFSCKKNPRTQKQNALGTQAYSQEPHDLFQVEINCPLHFDE